MFFLWCSVLFASEDVLFSSNELKPLYSISLKALKPLKIDIFWQRNGNQQEIVYDWYVRNNGQPITIKEIFDKCHVKDLLKAMTREKSLSLEMVVAVSVLEQPEPMLKKAKNMNSDFLNGMVS